MKKLLPIFIALIALTSFSSENKITFEKKIIGVWMDGDCELKDDATCLKKVKSFKEDNSGFQFKKGGKLVRRQNTGKCATPPISYGNYTGTWKKTSSMTLTIKYKYFAGTIEEDWKIVEITDKKIIFKVIDTRRQGDKVIPTVKN
jgi:hypothetical protein